MTPTTLREMLLRDEGCRLRPYKDSQGLLTIGVGRCLDRKGISQSEADFLLDHDILEYSAAVVAHLPWSIRLDEVRRAVLVNLCFNLGAAGLMQFKKMLAAFESGDYAGAARELLDSRYARQVGLRAERLAKQLTTGEWV